MTNFETFSQLHRQADPFLLANAWDAHSAVLFEASGYKATGTSSQALATALGYADGEQLPFSLLLQSVKKMAASVRIPFTTDLEGGYSRSIEGITENISKLYDAGVAGINLEDTVPGIARSLQPADVFEKTIAAVANYTSRNNVKIFLNIRTDAFLLGMPNAVTETLERIKRYELAGADGIFTPCITLSNDIKQVVEETRLPVNVMCMPGLPGFDELQVLGVKRISMGPFFFNKVYESIRTLSDAIAGKKDFSAIL